MVAGEAFQDQLEQPSEVDFLGNGAAAAAAAAMEEGAEDTEVTFGDPSEALLRGRDDSENSREYLMCATKRLQENGETTVKLGGLGALQGATGASDKVNAVDYVDRPTVLRT